MISAFESVTHEESDDKVGSAIAKNTIIKLVVHLSDLEVKWLLL